MAELFDEEASARLSLRPEMQEFGFIKYLAMIRNSEEKGKPFIFLRHDLDPSEHEQKKVVFGRETY